MHDIKILRETENVTGVNPEQANDDGLVAVGSNLNADNLMSAYRQGLFPWYESDQPTLWWCPDPRSVINVESLHISRSMQRILRKGELNSIPYTVTYNAAFAQVVKYCAEVRANTWIDSAMFHAYCELHELGVAESTEVWLNNEMVGGIYGVKSGLVFSGESMFHTHPNASKVALIKHCQRIFLNGYELLDCQIPNAHTQSLGAFNISRATFLDYLK